MELCEVHVEEDKVRSRSKSIYKREGEQVDILISKNQALQIL